MKMCRKRDVFQAMFPPIGTIPKGLISQVTHGVKQDLCLNAHSAKEKGRIVGGFSLRRQGCDTADKAGIQTSLSEAGNDHMEAVFGQLDYDIAPKTVGPARNPMS